MATWLKLTDGRHTTTLLDLDKVIQFAHNARDREVFIHVGNSSTVISEKASPVAYQKVLAYMRELEQPRQGADAEPEARQAGV